MRSQVYGSEASTITSQACDFQYISSEDFTLLSDFVIPSPQSQQQTSTCGNLVEDETCQEMFEGLSNINHLESIFTPDKKLFPSVLNKDNEAIISESEFIQKKNESSKRVRSAEQNKLHNITERKRRDRIKEKMSSLQELIPNCNKSDRASMLDDAIEYVKALKLQTQMMSTGREAMWQAGIQSSSTQQIPQFVPYIPMGFGMGMVNMSGYSAAGGTGLPQFLSVPSSSTSTPTSLPLFSGPRFVPFPDQFQVPPSFMASQATPRVTTSIVEPQLIPRDFSNTFNPTNQGEPTSQYITKTAMDHDNWKVPNPDQGYEVLANLVAPPHSVSENNGAETSYFDSGAGCDNSSR
ncbi:hypothetical protein M0R45_021143 [Rubus argutus]|uniref:BHLH domain-containing protein n=1 Tax=Rubus argutus TaxID=59490 RepID=A0AAW1XE24_RUBAR